MMNHFFKKGVMQILETVVYVMVHFRKVYDSCYNVTGPEYYLFNYTPILSDDKTVRRCNYVNIIMG